MDQSYGGRVVDCFVAFDTRLGDGDTHTHTQTRLRGVLVLIGLAPGESFLEGWT